jgi:hypothetical protein
MVRSTHHSTAGVHRSIIQASWTCNTRGCLQIRFIDMRELAAIHVHFIIARVSIFERMALFVLLVGFTIASEQTELDVDQVDSAS